MRRDHTPESLRGYLRKKKKKKKKKKKTPTRNMTSVAPSWPQHGHWRGRSKVSRTLLPPRISPPPQIELTAHLPLCPSSSSYWGVDRQWWWWWSWRVPIGTCDESVALLVSLRCVLKGGGSYPFLFFFIFFFFRLEDRNQKQKQKKDVGFLRDHGFSCTSQ